jgi:hypothetical protein
MIKRTVSRKLSSVPFLRSGRKETPSQMDPGESRRDEQRDSAEADALLTPTGQKGKTSDAASWFNEASSSSSSVEAFPIQPTTPPPRPPTSQPRSPVTTPSSILKSPKSIAETALKGASAGSSPAPGRERSKSVTFNERPSIYNLPAGSAAASSNNSQEELWREDVLPKYWRHERSGSISEDHPQDRQGHEPAVSQQQEQGFVRTATTGEYMLPFSTPLGIEHIRFSQAELERYNALRKSAGAENRIPSLVEFLRSLREN